MPATLVAFIAIFLVGALLRGTGLLGRIHAERLASAVFSVSLPATILISLDAVPFASTAWKLPAAACLITLPMALVAWQFGRTLDLPRPTQGGLILATGCINSIYFAYPVILAVLGDDGLANAILFDLGQTTFTLTGLYAIALWHGMSGSTAHSLTTRFVSSAPLWALATVLTMKALSLRLPPWARELLMPLHLTTTPLASLVLGLSVTLSALKQTWQLAAFGVVLRMGGGFVLGWFAATLLQLAGVERAVVMLVGGMPSAVMAVLFAAETKLDEDLVASIVGLSICLGVALLPWIPTLAGMVLG